MNLEDGLGEIEPDDVNFIRHGGNSSLPTLDDDPNQGHGGRWRPCHHARRKFFELADIAKNARRGKSAASISPMALEAVKRSDVLFAIEREMNGYPAEHGWRSVGIAPGHPSST